MLHATSDVPRNLFWGITVLGGINLLNSRSDVILPHKMFTWADFFFWGGGYKTDITTSLRPCTPQLVTYLKRIIEIRNVELLP